MNVKSEKNNGRWQKSNKKAFKREGAQRPSAKKDIFRARRKNGSKEAMAVASFGRDS